MGSICSKVSQSDVGDCPVATAPTTTPHFGDDSAVMIPVVTSPTIGSGIELGPIIPRIENSPVGSAVVYPMAVTKFDESGQPTKEMRLSGTPSRIKHSRRSPSETDEPSYEFTAPLAVGDDRVTNRSSVSTLIDRPDFPDAFSTQSADDRQSQSVSAVSSFPDAGPTAVDSMLLYNRDPDE